MALQKTRNKLVDIARQVFAKQGYENTTMNDIAQASGKGRRTLYTYFDNKESLYYAVIMAEMDRLSERMNQTAHSPLPVEDKLIEVIYAHLDLIKDAVQRNGNLRAEFFRNIFLVSKVRKKFDATEQSILTQIIEEGVKAGVFEVENIPLTVHIIHYSVRGLEIPYIHGRISDGLSEDIRRDIVRRLIHKALQK